jgi:hypothetical protein
LDTFYLEHWDADAWDIPDTPYVFIPDALSLQRAVQEIQNGAEHVTIEGILDWESGAPLGSEGTVTLSLFRKHGFWTWDVTGWDVDPPQPERD